MTHHDLRKKSRIILIKWVHSTWKDWLRIPVCLWKQRESSKEESFSSSTRAFVIIPYMMHASFHGGLGWVYIIHKNADLLLLVSIITLGILPLVSIYIIESEKYVSDPLVSPSSCMQYTPELIRSCLRGFIYLFILLPYVLALLSTYISIQLIRGHSRGIGGNNGAYHLSPEMQKYRAGAMHIPLYSKVNRVCLCINSLWRLLVLQSSTWRCWPLCPQILYQILKESDMAPEATNDECLVDYHPKDANSMTRWKVPYPGSRNINNTQSNLRTVPGDCIVCFQRYKIGDRVLWSSNPKCVHCYHVDCLQAWMQPWSHHHQKCPCCRQEYFPPPWHSE